LAFVATSTLVPVADGLGKGLGEGLALADGDELPQPAASSADAMAPVINILGCMHPDTEPGYAWECVIRESRMPL
jgi:hypothetical protein